MRKDKLIKLLQAIPGNPQVMIWNGFVGDWMDISPDLVEQLVRQSFDIWKDHCELQFKRPMTPNELADMRRNYARLHPWEFNEFVDEDMILRRHYHARKVFLLQAKERGIRTFDRLGTVEY
jgi:hypothetical protein